MNTFTKPLVWIFIIIIYSLSTDSFSSSFLFSRLQFLGCGLFNTRPSILILFWKALYQFSLAFIVVVAPTHLDASLCFYVLLVVSTLLLKSTFLLTTYPVLFHFSKAALFNMSLTCVLWQIYSFVFRSFRFTSWSFLCKACWLKYPINLVTG